MWLTRLKNKHEIKSKDFRCVPELLVMFFDLQNGFTFVGTLKLTEAPGRTRKSFDLIFMLIF